MLVYEGTEFDALSKETEFDALQEETEFDTPEGDRI